MGKVGRIYRYKPNYTIPPGAYVQEWLEAYGHTQAWLAEKIDRPVEQVNRLIKGRIRLDARWAVALEKIMKRPAELLMTWEANHRLFLERKKK